MTQYTAEALKAKCEEGFTVGPSTSHYLSVTGEPYVQFCNGIRVDSDFIEWALTAKKAFEATLDSFRKYAEGKSGAIYWRIEPEFSEHRGRCAFYMRLLISDKPVLAKPRAAA